MLFRKIYQTLLVSTVSVLSLGGGREAGRSLRQGQLPVYDFPPPSDRGRSRTRMEDR